MYLPDADGNQRPQYSLIPNSANLSRGRYNTSNSLGLTKQDCEAKGLGYTSVVNAYGVNACYFPCPDSYTIDPTDPSLCNPRPLLTKLDVYYGILAKAVKDCAELIPAYKDAVAEAGNDPSQVGFPADSGCVNPFDPPQSNTGGEGVYDPSASNGDPTKPADAPPMTNPEGTSGTSGSAPAGSDNTGEPSIPTVPDGTSQQPYIPPPPAETKEFDEFDESGMSTTLPRSRLTITEEQISQLPTVNDFGTQTESDLAIRLRQHPTLLDAQPVYLTEFQALLPSFQWECTITQAEFDLLPDDWKCRLCEDYQRTIYDEPSNIQWLRDHAPTITITANAPTAPPRFTGCPQDAKRVACVSRTGYDNKPCAYTGGCNGECVCPQAPTNSSSSYAPAGTDSSALTIGLIVAGGVLITILLLK